MTKLLPLFAVLIAVFIAILLIFYNVEETEASVLSGHNPPIATKVNVAQCGGHTVTIKGTSGPDVLRGTHGDDVIMGFGGKDKIFAGGGNDIICGGPKLDVIAGGAGHDIIFGNRGIDFIDGGIGKDRVRDRLAVCSRVELGKNCKPYTPPPPPPPPAPVVPSWPWDALAQCESGGNWQINTGNGYYGGIQFALSSWQAVGGTGYPHHHSREEQIHRGIKLQAIQGWGAWPSCSRQLGLR